MVSTQPITLQTPDLMVVEAELVLRETVEDGVPSLVLEISQENQYKERKIFSSRAWAFDPKVTPVLVTSRVDTASDWRERGLGTELFRLSDEVLRQAQRQFPALAGKPLTERVYNGTKWRKDETRDWTARRATEQGFSPNPTDPAFFFKTLP